MVDVCKPRMPWDKELTWARKRTGDTSWGVGICLGPDLILAITENHLCDLDQVIPGSCTAGGESTSNRDKDRASLLAVVAILSRIEDVSVDFELVAAFTADSRAVSLDRIKNVPGWVTAPIDCVGGQSHSGVPFRVLVLLLILTGENAVAWRQREGCRGASGSKESGKS